MRSSSCVVRRIWNEILPVALALFLTVSSVIVFAQTSPVPSSVGEPAVVSYTLNSFTLEECIAIALENQPAIDVQRSALGAADERRKIARSFFHPQVSFEARYTLLDESRTVDSPGLSDPAFADVFSDAAAFFGIANQAGSAAANFALDNPEVSGFNALKQQALNGFDPNFSTGIIGENSLTTQFLLIQPLWTGGKIRYRHDQAKLGVRVASADVEKSRQTTSFQVTRAYLGIQLARELNIEVTDAIGFFRAIERFIEALLDEGDEFVSTVDQSRARTVRLIAESQKVRLEQASELACAALRQAMGLDYTADVEIAEPRLSERRRQIKLAAILHEALLRRPELNKVWLASEVAELERKLAKAQYAPDVGLFSRFSTITDDRNFLNPNDDQEWAVGVSVGVPLYTGGRRSAQKRQAEFQQAKLRQSEKLLRELITLELQKAYLEYVEASKNLLLTEHAAKEADETIDGLQNRFLGDQIEESDMPDYFEDLILARILRTQTRTQYNQTLFQYNLALAKIRLGTASDEFQADQMPIDTSQHGTTRVSNPDRTGN